MRISDLIADFIGEMLEDTGGQTEIQRADVASRFGCVPSQINYVISTRFSPEHGYVVESRRGGGGYIRIRRVQADPAQMVMHTVNAIGDVLDEKTARAFLSNLVAAGALDAGSEHLIMAAIGDYALRPVEKPVRDMVRASIIKQMLTHFIQ